VTAFRVDADLLRDAQDRDDAGIQLAAAARLVLADGA